MGFVIDMNQPWTVKTSNLALQGFKERQLYLITVRLFINFLPINFYLNLFSKGRFYNYISKIYDFTQTFIQKSRR